jgi:hypothetical protein
LDENTTTVEGIDFRAADVNASAVADKIGHSFHKLHEVTERAREKLSEFGKSALMGGLASVGLGLGLHEIYGKAKEAHLEIDRVKKSVAGAQFAFQGWKPGLSQLDKMKYSTEQASGVTKKLREMELSLHAPLEDLGATYNQVAQVGFGRLGMSQKGVLELTEKITAAAKVYGISGTEAIEKVNRALLIGHVGLRDTTGLADTLRTALHMKKGEHLSPEEMMKRMEKGLGDMVPAAKELGKDMEGGLFEAEHLVKEMLVDLTGPLFSEQTKSLSEWVKKLREVKEDGKSIMQIYGEKLAGYFDKLKSATAFIVDHWKSLFALYATSKFAGLMGAGTSGGLATALGYGGGGGAASAMGLGELLYGKKVRGSMGMLITDSTTFGDRLRSASGGLGGFTGKLLSAAPALTALYIGASAFADWANSRHEANQMEAAKLDLDTYDKLSAKRTGTGEDHPAAALADYLRMTELGDKYGADPKAVARMFSAMDTDQRTKWADKLGSKMQQEVVSGQGGAAVFSRRDISPEGLATAFGESVAAALIKDSAAGIGVLANKDNMLSWGAGSPNTKKDVPHGNINIQNLTITQDFKEADPDRVFHKVSTEIAALGHGNSRFNNRAGI